MSKQDRQGARTPADLERKYNFGKTFADVFGLTTDLQKYVEEIESELKGLTSEEIFNRLTNYGTVQGIYKEGDQVYINATYIKSGKIAAEFIDATELEVFAANVTGVLSSSSIQLGGALEVYDSPNEGAELGGFLGYVSSWDDADNPTYGIGMDVVVDRTEHNVLVVTTGGVRMSSYDKDKERRSNIVATGNINMFTDGNIWLDGSDIHMYADENIYMNAIGIYANDDLITSSDRRKKNEIQYDIDKYIALFDSLTPASFYYTEHNCGKRHLGFIAQDVEEAMVSAGIKHEEFAPLDIRSDGFYGLRYGEFIPILVAKIQQLDKEVKAWKRLSES